MLIAQRFDLLVKKSKMTSFQRIITSRSPRSPTTAKQWSASRSCPQKDRISIYCGCSEKGQFLRSLILSLCFFLQWVVLVLTFPTNNRPFLFKFFPLLSSPKRSHSWSRNPSPFQTARFPQPRFQNPTNSANFLSHLISCHLTSLEEQELFDSPEIDVLRPREPSDKSGDSIKSDHFQIVRIEHFSIHTNADSPYSGPSHVGGWVAFIDRILHLTTSPRKVLISNCRSILLDFTIGRPTGSIKASSIFLESSNSPASSHWRIDIRSFLIGSSSLSLRYICSRGPPEWSR
jgi:hypothetical protein